MQASLSSHAVKSAIRVSYLEDHLIHSLIKEGRHQTICLTSVAVQETEPCLGDVCINVTNPPQCHLVNQPPWGKADQDADGLTGAFFLSVLIIYAHAAWLAGGLCAFRGGVSGLCRPYCCCSSNSNGCTVLRNQNRSDWFRHTGLKRLSCSCISSIMRPDRCYCASTAACEEAGSKKVIENLRITSYVLNSRNIIPEAPLKQGEYQQAF